MHNHFTWVDLSTFDTETTKNFYHNIFGWDYSDDAGYITCKTARYPCAGIYEMPAFFQKINMPSFWMSYILVKDIDTIVAKAKALGGKVELEEESTMGRVALIRDPAGAGFTCYQGEAQPANQLRDQHGHWAWNELFVSDLSLVENFYTELFDWELVSDGKMTDRHIIHHASGEAIGAIQVASNDIKGDKEFWGIYFKADNLKKCLEKITDGGGYVVYNDTNSNGTYHLAHDPQGAAFLITEAFSTPTVKSGKKQESSTKPNTKWRSIIGLIAVYIAIFFEANWVWGLLFLFWVIPDLKSGTTYFIEPLTRRQNPILYWSIVLTWLLLSVYLLAEAFYFGK